MKIHPFDRVLSKRFGSVLHHGSHNPDGKACALEAASVARGKRWSDDPGNAGLPDLRPINDGPWSSDEARTKAMVPAIRALWGWPKWGETKQKALTNAVTLRMIREVLPDIYDAIGLDEHAKTMRESADLAMAARAAEATSAAAEAARAAAAAAGSAWAVAVAARAAAVAAGADRVLTQACRIWQEEAERSEKGVEA